MEITDFMLDGADRRDRRRERIAARKRELSDERLDGIAAWAERIDAGQGSRNQPAPRKEAA